MAPASTRSRATGLSILLATWAGCTPLTELELPEGTKNGLILLRSSEGTVRARAFDDGSFRTLYDGRDKPEEVALISYRCDLASLGLAPGPVPLAFSPDEGTRLPEGDRWTKASDGSASWEPGLPDWAAELHRPGCQDLNLVYETVTNVPPSDFWIAETPKGLLVGAPNASIYRADTEGVSEVVVEPSRIAGVAVIDGTYLALTQDGSSLSVSTGRGIERLRPSGTTTISSNRPLRVAGRQYMGAAELLLLLSKSEFRMYSEGQWSPRKKLCATCEGKEWSDATALAADDQLVVGLDWSRQVFFPGSARGPISLPAEVSALTVDPDLGLIATTAASIYALQDGQADLVRDGFSSLQAVDALDGRIVVVDGSSIRWLVGGERCALQARGKPMAIRDIGVGLLVATKVGDRLSIGYLSNKCSAL